jgi:predicted RNase H-like HicB family nuclease
MMMPDTYQVDAQWDAEASVWVATSDDVPGLATEAETLEALSQKLKTMIPELLQLNQTLDSRYAGTIAFQVTSRRQELIHVA